MNNLNRVVCSVGIATFKRPILLEELIKSLYDQKGLDDLLIEIIIVDNDNSQSAKRIFDKFKDETEIIISYFTQPVQNISLTRNLALEKASGEFILILDDDETADPYWIRSLVNTAIKYEADAVFGFVEAVFPENAPDWIKQREIYFKPMGNTGEPPLFQYTTNCLIRTSFLKKCGARFDPAYGLSGGEDGIFFDLMRNAGAKFVVCREAITYEVIPEYRTKLKFLFDRHFQRGNNYGIYMVESSDNRFQKARAKILLRAFIAVLFYGTQCIVFILDKKKWVFGFINLSLNLGKITGATKLKFSIYKSEHKKFE